MVSGQHFHLLPSYQNHNRSHRNTCISSPLTPPRPVQTQPIAQPPIPSSAYQTALDASQPLPQLTTSDVRYWSDYNRVFYHPRSLQPISLLSLTDSLAPFERFDAGEEVFRLLDGEHGLLDRDVRPWLEECDLLQAVQVVAGVDDAWGGFATRLVEGLRDEVGKTGIWVAGVEQGGRSGRVSIT